MNRKRYTPERIIGKLREAEVALAQAASGPLFFLVRQTVMAAGAFSCYEAWGPRKYKHGYFFVDSPAMRLPARITGSCSTSFTNFYNPANNDRKSL